MTINFMIHCGGTHVPRTSLDLVPLPSVTDTYRPIAHREFADIIENQLVNSGYSFGEQVHALNHEGQQYFGMAELLDGQQVHDKDWSLIAGWRSSYNKSLSASFVVGSQVFVCDNLAFFGEIKIARKHTPNIVEELPYLIGDAVNRTREAAELQQKRYQHYKDFHVTDKSANDTIIHLLRKGVITSGKVKKVVDEYYDPSHLEHLNEHGNKTTWTLFNAATEALKGTGLAHLPQRTIKLHNIIDDVTSWKKAA